MGTHHVYSRKLAGFLFPVALVALCCGGCGKTVSKGGPALAPAPAEPCVVNSEGSAGESDEGTLTISDEPSADRAGVLGYSDPAANERMATPSLNDDGYMLEQVGDAEDGGADTATPSMADRGEDRMEMIDEGSNGEANEGRESGDDRDGTYEETPCTPEPTEQEYTPEPIGDGNDEGSDIVTPYMDGENETTTDGNCVDVAAAGLGATTMFGMGWMWTSDARLLLDSWWQAMITDAEDTGVRPYEAYVPAMPPDAGTCESGNESEPGP